MVDKLSSGLFALHTNLLLEAAFLTAYYRFLRREEFTINNKIFDLSHNLLIKNISFHIDYFSIYLKHSKTDRDYNRTTINIPRINSSYFPLITMNQFLSSHVQALVCLTSLDGMPTLWHGPHVETFPSSIWMLFLLI